MNAINSILGYSDYKEAYVYGEIDIDRKDTTLLWQQVSEGILTEIVNQVQCNVCST